MCGTEYNRVCQTIPVSSHSRCFLALPLCSVRSETVITFSANTSIQHVWSCTVWLYILLVVVANAGKDLSAKSVISIFM